MLFLLNGSFREMQSSRKGSTPAVRTFGTATQDLKVENKCRADCSFLRT